MPDTDNGRITLAILGEKMDALARSVDALRPDHDRLVIAEQCILRNADSIRDLEMLIDKLANRARTTELQLAKFAVFYGLLSGAGAAVLTVLITKALGL